ncbi:TRAP transporter small permease subunit [Microbulbifer rhizosphaerae]|uniref:TRAP transporter small permease protein n=1 Tax=Microbulbifer rhizosphaerae TaxID=1562603 RepID=A0A7W4W8Z0_9GAMM|nr:C4-dicarboxylate transporter DctQ subunit [Microbulbifer rhizosphaerae]
MNIKKFIERLEEGCISALLVAMTLLVFVEVVLRFGFGVGVMWIGELTLTVSAWFVLFGMSYGLKIGAHIGVDALVRLLPRTGRRICTAIAVLICLAYCGLIMYGGWVYVGKLHMIGLEMEDLPLPKWSVTSILLVGFGLMALRLLHLLWDVIRGTADGFSHTDEVKESLQLADKENIAPDRPSPKLNAALAEGA